MEKINFESIKAQLEVIKNELSEIEKAQEEASIGRKIVKQTETMHTLVDGILAVTAKIPSGNGYGVKLFPDKGWCLRKAGEEEYHPLFSSKVLENKNPKYKFREYLLDLNEGRLYGPESWNYLFLDYEYITSLMEGKEEGTFHGNGINDDAIVIVRKQDYHPYRKHRECFMIRDLFLNFTFTIFR